MTRESQEFYQGGETVMIGTYRNLKTGHLVRITEDGQALPEPEQGLATYEWISGDPNWLEEQPSQSQ